MATKRTRARIHGGNKVKGPMRPAEINFTAPVALANYKKLEAIKRIEKLQNGGLMLLLIRQYEQLNGPLDGENTIPSVPPHLTTPVSSNGRVRRDSKPAFTPTDGAYSPYVKGHLLNLPRLEQKKRSLVVLQAIEIGDWEPPTYDDLDPVQFLEDFVEGNMKYTDQEIRTWAMIWVAYDKRRRK